MDREKWKREREGGRWGGGRETFHRTVFLVLICRFRVGGNLTRDRFFLDHHGSIKLGRSANSFTFFSFHKRARLLVWRGSDEGEGSCLRIFLSFVMIKVFVLSVYSERFRPFVPFRQIRECFVCLELWNSIRRASQQGDQIGRILANWATCGRSLWFFEDEVAQVMSKLWLIFDWAISFHFHLNTQSKNTVCCRYFNSSKGVKYKCFGL